MRISDWSSDVCSSDLICREIERIDRVAQFALKPFRLRWIINIGEIGSFAHPIADEAENQPVVGIEAVIIGHINVQSLGTLRSEVEAALKKSRQLESTIRNAWKDKLKECVIQIRTNITAIKIGRAHTSELQSLMRISYAVFCLKKKNKIK